MSKIKFIGCSRNKIILLVSMNHKHTVINRWYSACISFLINNLNDTFITIFRLFGKLDDKDIQDITSVSKCIYSIIKQYIVSNLELIKVCTIELISFQIENNCILKCKFFRFFLKERSNNRGLSCIEAVLNLWEMIKLLFFKINIKRILQQLLRKVLLEIFYFSHLSSTSLSLDIQPPSHSPPPILRAVSNFMIGNIRDLKDNQKILRHFDTLHSFRCSAIIQDKLSTRMILQIVRKCIFPIFNHIIMAKQIIPLEVIGSEDVVGGILHIAELRELAAQALFEEIQ